MRKSVVAAAAAAILAGSAATYAIAQDAKDNKDAAQKPRVENRWQPSPADRAAFAGARVAALHAGLALTPEQEKLWPPVEAVLRDLAAKREARMDEMRAAREKGERPDPMSRLRRSADFMTQTGADLKRLADASQPLYDKLDDQQKNRLEQMVREGMHNRMREGFRERMSERFAGWRDRMEHWRDRDGDDRGMMRRHRDDRGDNDDYGSDSEERL